MARLTKTSWDKSSLRTKEVTVDELGGEVLIRELPASTAADLSGLVEAVTVGREQRMKVDIATMERRQFAYGVIDENHNPLFTEEEVQVLQDKHGHAFRTVVGAIDELSGVNKEELEKAEARFPGLGTGANGAHVGDAPSAGSAGPHVPARAGAGVADASEGDV